MRASESGRLQGGRLQVVYQAHDFRHRMTIEQATETQDTDGSVIQTWSNFAAIQAWYETFEGNESFIAQGITATVIHKIITRELSGVIPKMRILFGSRVLEIISVLPFQQGQMRLMKLLCYEII